MCGVCEVKDFVLYYLPGVKANARCVDGFADAVAHWYVVGVAWCSVAGAQMLMHSAQSGKLPTTYAKEREM